MYVGPVYKIIKFIMYEAKKLDKGNVTTTSLFLSVELRVHKNFISLYMSLC